MPNFQPQETNLNKEQVAISLLILLLALVIPTTVVFVVALVVVSCACDLCESAALTHLRSFNSFSLNAMNQFNFSS